MELTTSEQQLMAIKALAVTICIICALFWLVLQTLRSRLKDVRDDRDLWRDRCLAHKATINASSGASIRKELEERPNTHLPGTATVRNARKAQDKINQRRFKGDNENGRNKHGRYGESNPDLVVAASTIGAGMVMSEVIDEIGDLMESGQDSEPDFDIHPMGVSDLEETGTPFSECNDVTEEEPEVDSDASCSDDTDD